jgi:hypothetical protein
MEREKEREREKRISYKSLPAGYSSDKELICII